MLAKNAKPRYTHDCDKCTFLGSVTYPGPLADGTTPLRNADLYYCTNSIEGGTVIARESSEGSEYASVPTKILEDHYLKMSKVGHFSTSAPALIAAYFFAKAKGLVK